MMEAKKKNSWKKLRTLRNKKKQNQSFQSQNYSYHGSPLAQSPQNQMLQDTDQHSQKQSCSFYSKNDPQLLKKIPKPSTHSKRLKSQCSIQKPPQIFTNPSYLPCCCCQCHSDSNKESINKLKNITGNSDQTSNCNQSVCNDQNLKLLNNSMMGSSNLQTLKITNIMSFHGDPHKGLKRKNSINQYNHSNLNKITSKVVQKGKDNHQDELSNPQTPSNQNQQYQIPKNKILKQHGINANNEEQLSTACESDKRKCLWTKSNIDQKKQPSELDSQISKLKQVSMHNRIPSKQRQVKQPKKIESQNNIEVTQKQKRPHTTDQLPGNHRTKLPKELMMNGKLNNQHNLNQFLSQSSISPYNSNNDSKTPKSFSPLSLNYNRNSLHSRSNTPQNQHSSNNSLIKKTNSNQQSLSCLQGTLQKYIQQLNRPSTQSSVYKNIQNKDEKSTLTKNNHILMEYDPAKGRTQFMHQDNEIKLDENHYLPMFIAKDIEELRQNPQTRKVLKQFRIFTGQNQDQYFSGLKNPIFKNDIVVRDPPKQIEKQQEIPKNKSPKKSQQPHEIVSSPLIPKNESKQFRKKNSQQSRDNSLQQHKKSVEKQDKNNKGQQDIKPQQEQSQENNMFLQIPKKNSPQQKSAVHDQQQVQQQQQKQQNDNTVTINDVQPLKRENFNKEIKVIDARNSDQHLKYQKQNQTPSKQFNELLTVDEKQKIKQRKDSDAHLMPNDQDYLNINLLSKKRSNENQGSGQKSLSSCLTPSFNDHQRKYSNNLTEFSFEGGDMFNEGHTFRSKSSDNKNKSKNKTTLKPNLNQTSNLSQTKKRAQKKKRLEPYQYLVEKVVQTPSQVKN